MIIECILLAASFCRQPTCYGVGCAKKHADKPVLALLATSVTVMAIDYHRTIAEAHRYHAGFDEHDPIVRPLVSHPLGLYALGSATDLAAALLGHRMRQSHRWYRHVWWLPQVGLIGTNANGYVFTVRHFPK